MWGFIMDTKNNRGNSSFACIIASGLMTLKVTNHFLKLKKKKIVLLNAPEIVKTINQNALILAGSLMRYKDVKALDDF